MNIQKIYEDLASSDTVPELTLHFKRSILSKKRLIKTKEQVDFLRAISKPGTFEFQEQIIVLIIR